MLLTTGYTRNAAAHYGVLDPGAQQWRSWSRGCASAGCANPGARRPLPGLAMLRMSPMTAE
ncbi:hypothetical protein [Variovorax sp. HW608]|uniref:hypothetical protein n=1 Tax=Variovorax sp. HW608 TaxID=1034889 RepID=UPI0018D56882|nr:hypothetical protein [Variovorax sp. HW608]